MSSSKDSKTVEKSDIFSNLHKDGLRIGKSVIIKAKKGNTGAMCKIGDAYLNKGTHSAHLKAFRWYNMAALAPKENATAQYKIGFIFYNGLGPLIDFREALEWYHKAADQNQPDALNSIGSMYLQGHGVDVSHKQALMWFHKAAAQGSIDALYNIGTFYEKGICVTKDKRKALEWYERAAKMDVRKAKDKIKSLTEQSHSLEDVGSSPKKEKANTYTHVQEAAPEQVTSTEIQESNKENQDGSKKSKKKEAKRTIDKLERKLEKEKQKTMELKKKVKDLKSEGKENIKRVEQSKQENIELLQQLEEMKQKDQKVEDRFKMLEDMISQTNAMTVSLCNQMGNGHSRSSHRPKKNQNKLW